MYQPADFYFDDSILQLIDEIYFETKVKRYDQLPQDDQEDLVAACMDVLQDEAYECLIENDFTYLLTHNVKYFLKTANQQFSHDLMQVCVKSAMQYFHDGLQFVYDERIAEKHYHIAA